jgi:hypothetical protein
MRPRGSHGRVWRRRPSVVRAGAGIAVRSGPALSAANGPSEHVAAFLGQLHEAPTNTTRAWHVIRSPITALGAARWFVRLPRIRVDLDRVQDRPEELYTPYGSHAPSGARSGARLPALRIGQAVLVLPEAPADYLHGRSRHALRTNVSAGRRAGLTTARVDALVGARIAGNIARDRDPQAPPLPGADSHPEEATVGLDYWVAHDAAGRIAAIAAVLVRPPWARLECLLTARRHPDAMVARWVLHTEVVVELIGRGARYLQSDSAVLVGEGMRYFQQRVGYRPVNISVHQPPRARRHDELVEHPLEEDARCR